MADDIVGDEVHEEFACDHVGRAVAEYFHAEEGFEFAEVQFDSPALVVEFAKGFDGVEFGVEEGGNDEATGSAEAFSYQMDLDDAEGDGVGSVGKFLLADGFGELAGFDPDLEAVVGAELFAFGHVGFAGLIESDDAVDAAFFEFCKSEVGAESSICEKDVVFF